MSDATTPRDLIPSPLPRVYTSDDYPALASLASGRTSRASHVQIVLECVRALDEIAGLREDLANERRRTT